jgi:hypothetical protein
MKYSILVVALLITVLLRAQVTVDWVNEPGGVSIATDASNNVFTANWDYNPGGDITVTKRDANGNLLWNATYDNTNSTRHEVATWVETDQLGNVLVCGTIRSGYSNPVNANSLLMKFSPSGVLLWRKVYETDFDGSSTKKCLVDTDNNIYVLGLGTGPNGMVTKVKKFRPNGNTLWSFFDAAGVGAPVNFKFTPDNHIVISCRGITGSINGYLKIDLNGNQVWSLAGINSLTVGDAAGDSFGNTYLINGNYVNNTGSIVKKLSPNGAVIWDSNNTMAGSRIEVGSDNLPVISGFPSSGGSGAAFMKFDTNGNMLWQNLDADGPSYNLLLHAQMKMDAQNAAYLAAGTLFEVAVCKVNSDGTSAWTQTTSGGGYANGFDFGTDNSVFVTGGISAARILQGGTPTCTTPTGLITGAIFTNKAKIKWGLVPGAVQYEIWYKKTADANWNILTVNGLVKSATLKPLICSTPYEWKIRTLCDTVGTDLVSDFSPVQNFNTLSCLMPEVVNVDPSSTNNEAPAEFSSPALQVFPTITSGSISVKISGLTDPAEGQIKIIDGTGKLLHQENIRLQGNMITDIDLDTLAPGIYFLVADFGKHYFSDKFIKL